VSVLGRETWIVLATGIASAGAAGAIAWTLRKREREPEDVVVGFIGPSLAAMYLLVLALALVTEWQTIDSAQQAIGNEAVAIREIYWSAAGLPPAAGSTLRTQDRDYLTTLLRHDWPQMERGAPDGESLRQITVMTTSVLRINAVTSSAAAAQQYALGQLSALAAACAQREAAAGSRLPVGLLAAVVVTSLIVGGFPFASGIRAATASVSVTVLQAALVAIAVVVVFQLNNPFVGPLGTGPGALTGVAAEIGAR
jgi:hypothetical protein